MERMAWELVASDRSTCKLRRKQNGNYIIALMDEGYEMVMFDTKEIKVDTSNLELSPKVKELYKDSELPILKPEAVMLGTPGVSSTENVIDDTLYVLLTSDKKCILRGRKTTRFVLSTIYETSNSKVFTCRQFNQLVKGFNNKNSTKRVYLTDEVKKLYNTDEIMFNSETMPNFIAVKAQTQYKIEL